MEPIVLNFTDYTCVEDCITDRDIENIIEVIKTATQDEVSFSKWDLCEKIQKQIDICTPDNIEIINSNIDGAKPKLFKRFNEQLWTQEYVGVVNVKVELEHDNVSYEIPLTLNFRSRFDDSLSSGFLMYVFEKAFDIKGKIYIDMEIEGAPESTWDFLLMILFVNQLNNAMRKGIFKQYREFEHNDSNVKGRIDVARHIKENPVANGKIAYVTREYTADNYINHLILKAAELLERRYRSPFLNLLKGYEVCSKGLALLRGELFDSIQLSVREIVKHTNKKIVNCVYKDYEALRKTAILILKRLGINSFKSSNNKVSGLLIDMTKLWETFLHNEIFKSITFSDGNYKQETYAVLEGKREVIPDFLIPQNQPNTTLEKGFVFDAKYKHCWSDAYKSEKWNDDTRVDVFQIMSYMLVFNCIKGGFVFPMKNHNVSDIQSFNIGQGCKDRDICLIPYVVPKSDNALLFRRQMEVTSKNIRNSLTKLINANEANGKIDSNNSLNFDSKS